MTISPESWTIRALHNSQGRKMREMRYEAPKTLDAAVALLAGAQGVARMLAGGTDLLIQMRGGRRAPGVEDSAPGRAKRWVTKGEIATTFLSAPIPPHSADAYLRFIPRTE